jgi:predicted RND superfamily exporter protein
VPFRVTILVFYAGFFTFCAVGIPRVEMGLDLQEVVPENTYVHTYAKHTSRNYGSYSIFLVTEGVAFESTMEEQRALEHTFTTTVPGVDVAMESTSYARYYTDHVEAMVGQGAVCSSEIDLYRDEWLASADLCVLKGGANPNGYANCAKTCLAYRFQSAHGDQAVTKRCAFMAVANSADLYTCTCPYRAALKPGNFTSGFPAFLASGLRGSVSDALTTLRVSEDSTAIASSRSLYYVNDVFDVAAKVKHIKAAREAIKNSALVKDKGANVFAFDYALYALNEQYVHMEATTVFALGMSLIAAFGCMLVFIPHPTTCLVVTLLIVMVEVQLYGLLAWTGLKLNAVAMVNLIMSMGIAVEFLSHIARAFMLARGTRPERAAAAVNTLGSATANGALTTFLGILPIAFSCYGYFVNYFFLHYVVILAVCLLQGVVVLPVVLSMVGPKACILIEDKEEEGEGRGGTRM